MSDPRRLLVVGASPTRAAAFAVWRLMGIDVVLVDGYSTERYEHLANEFHAMDQRDGSADLGRITELARGCDGITTLADNSQLTVAAIAEDLGLPGVGRAAASVARSKLRQRALFEHSDVTIPSWRQVDAPRDLEAFYADGARPAVLKPVDCAGSAGVLRVDDVDAALRQWPVVRSISPSRTVIVEDFVEGREVCVDAVVTRGEAVFVSVCEADYTGPEGFIAVSALYATDQRDRAAATRAIQSLVTPLGLREATVHAEFKIDGDRWTLLETALRPGGALVPELTERVTGVSLYQAMARIAFGEAAPMPAPAQPSVPFAQVRFLVGAGQVRRFVPPAEIVRDLSDVKVVTQFAGPGRQVRRPVSEEGRAGCAVGWGPDRDRLDAQLREAVARLGRAMGLNTVDSAAHGPAAELMGGDGS
jgi:biotin carboxylase